MRRSMKTLFVNVLNVESQVSKYYTAIYVPEGCCKLHVDLSLFVNKRNNLRLLPAPLNDC